MYHSITIRTLSSLANWAWVLAQNVDLTSGLHCNVVFSIPTFSGAQDGGRAAIRPHGHPHAVAQLSHGRAQGLQRRPAQEPRQVGDRRVNLGN